MVPLKRSAGHHPLARTLSSDVPRPTTESIITPRSAVNSSGGSDGNARRGGNISSSGDIDGNARREESKFNSSGDIDGNARREGAGEPMRPSD